jgi:hypothetical protein
LVVLVENWTNTDSTSAILWFILSWVFPITCQFPHWNVSIIFTWRIISHYRDFQSSYHVVPRVMFR